MKKLIKSIIPKLRFNFPYEINDYSENLYMENYHKHSMYSLIDSATSMEDYADKIKEYNYKCLFSGEHGWQGQYFYIYNLCEQIRKDKDNPYNLKFRYSTEAYWVKDRKKIFFEEYIDKKGKTQTREKKDNTNCHIVLVAKNFEGLEDINFALSIANEDGYYYKPRLDFELLLNINPNNIIVTSACVAGWKYEDAEECWLKLHNHFKDNFFLEVQNHNTESQKKLNNRILKLAKQNNIQIIAGLDTHYISEEDRIKRENLLERKNFHYDDEEDWYMDFPNGKEVFRRFKEQNVLDNEQILTAIMNTCIFINECEDIKFDRSFKIPNTYKELNYKERCNLLDNKLSNYYELEEFKSDKKLQSVLYDANEIKESTVVDYFLTNEKIIKTAIEDEGGILTTTGRGSAPSFVLNKLLGFTTIDRFTSDIPMYSERFLTKERVLESHQMPDIDFNVAEQEPFVRASRKIIGEHSCYPLIAFGQLKVNNAWKLYAGINNVDPQTSNEVSKAITEYNKALKYCETEEDKEAIDVLEFIPNKYVEFYEKSKSYQGIIDGCKAHACGHLLLEGDIRRKIGIKRCVSETTGKSILTTVIDGSVLDDFGYVKNDYLIVDSVALTNKIYKSIGKKVPSFDELRELIKNDKETWDIYAKGITCCINQCEKESTTKKVMIYKPQNIEELTAFIAGIRPGFKSLINNFINRKPYTTGEKSIDDLLQSSYHYMLYQESIMLVLNYLGQQMKDTYKVIKSISKKKLKGKNKDDLNKILNENWIKIFNNDDNYSKIWTIINDSAFYAFNSPHAWSMAGDSLYLAYTKAHNTSKFYEESLNHYMGKGNKDKVALLLDEAKTYFGYKIGDYEYGKDNSKFNIDDKEKIIYPNMASIKGIGNKVILNLIDFYNKGYSDIITIYRNLKNTNINKTVFKDLIKIGYFKKMGSIKFLLSCIEILDKFDGKKTISKDKLSELCLTLEQAKKYGNETKKQINNVDSIKLINDLIKTIPDDEFSTIELVQMQKDVLGYVDYINPKLDKKICLVNTFDGKYNTKKLSLYCLNNGKSVDFKLYNKIYKNKPIKEGDIIYATLMKREPKPILLGEDEKGKKKWGKDMNTYEWILNDYNIIKEL